MQEDPGQSAVGVQGPDIQNRTFGKGQLIFISQWLYHKMYSGVPVQQRQKSELIHTMR